MFDRPGLILLVSLATFGPLIGLALVRLMNYIALNMKPPVKATEADTLFSFLTLFAIDLLNGLVISAFIARMYDEYKDMASRDEPRKAVEPKGEAWKPRGLIDMNTGKMVNAFDTPKLNIDLETSRMKRFSRTLLTQRANGFKIDLREKTWEGQFGGRKNYVRVRDVRMAGAFAKDNPELVNSPFGVCGESGWRVVERGARGDL